MTASAATFTVTRSVASAQTIALAYAKGDSKKVSDETLYLVLFGLSSNALFTKNCGTGKILNDD